MRLTRWFENPFGITLSMGRVDTPSREVADKTGTRKTPLNPKGALVGKGKVPHRIDEFHPRGGAGRREMHTLKGNRKKRAPRQGHRAK